MGISKELTRIFPAIHTRGSHQLILGTVSPPSITQFSINFRLHQPDVPVIFHSFPVQSPSIRLQANISRYHWSITPIYLDCRMGRNRGSLMKPYFKSCTKTLFVLPADVTVVLDLIWLLSCSSKCPTIWAYRENENGIWLVMWGGTFITRGSSGLLSFIWWFLQSISTL